MQKRLLALCTFPLMQAILIERTYIIDEFFAFYGRGTLLLYPFMVYICQRVILLKGQKKHVSVRKGTHRVL